MACLLQAFDKNFFMRDVRIGTGTLILEVSLCIMHGRILVR
jgi:hypothetical protein